MQYRDLPIDRFPPAKTPVSAPKNLQKITSASLPERFFHLSSPQPPTPFQILQRIGRQTKPACRNRAAGRFSLVRGKR
jgi:hypothetical protein